MRLKPQIIIGKAGISSTVLAAVEIALAKSPLLKVRILADDRDRRAEIVDELVDTCNAELIGRTGKTAAIYRKPQHE